MTYPRPGFVKSWYGPHLAPVATYVDALTLVGNLFDHSNWARVRDGDKAGFSLEYFGKTSQVSLVYFLMANPSFADAFHIRAPVTSANRDAALLALADLHEAREAVKRIILMALAPYLVQGSRSEVNVLPPPDGSGYMGCDNWPGLDMKVLVERQYRAQTDAFFLTESASDGHTAIQGGYFYALD